VNKDKRIYVFLFVALLVFVIMKGFSFSQNQEQMLVEEPDKWGHLTFAVQASAIKFFDHKTGKIYVYSAGLGKYVRAWKLEELGKNLVKEVIE